MLPFCYSRRHAYFQAQRAAFAPDENIDPTPPENPRFIRLIEGKPYKWAKFSRYGARKPRRKDRFTKQKGCIA